MNRSTICCFLGLLVLVKQHWPLLWHMLCRSIFAFAAVPCSSVRAIWLPFCLVCKHATYYLLMKFIACRLLLKKYCMAPWNNFALMLLLAKEQELNRLICHSIPLPLLEQRPKVA